MRPTSFLLVTALVGATACAPPRADLPTGLGDAIRAEIGPALLPVMREPIGTPAGDGDAADDYALARATLASLPPTLDEKTRLEHGRFGHGKPLPAVVVAALAEDPAVATIVEAVERGAARPYVSSPFSLLRRPGAQPAHFLSIADLVVMAARARAERGQAREARGALIALARMGQDLGRRADLVGFELGHKVDLTATDAFGLLPAVEDPAVVAALTAPLGALARDQPTWIDSMIDAARVRLALAGTAAGLTLGLAGWSGRTAAVAIEPWLAIEGGPGEVARRTLDEIARYRALPPRSSSRAIIEACEAAWRPGFRPCAEFTQAFRGLALLERLEAGAPVP